MRLSARPDRWRRRSSSQYLVDPVHRSARPGFTNAYGNDAVQECVPFRERLESRQGSKVVARRIDALSTTKRREHVRRAMTKPLERHIDQRAVICLQCDAQI